MKHSVLQQLALLALFGASVDAEPIFDKLFGSRRPNNIKANSGTQAGNKVQATYNLKDINADGGTLNLGVHSAQQGGEAAQAGAAPAPQLPATSGARRGIKSAAPLKGRDIELAVELFRRDFSDELDAETIELLVREAQFFDGGNARGGDSKSMSGNFGKSVQNFDGLEIGAGSKFSAGSVIQQQGGEARSGKGGRNKGNGGKGGAFSLGLGLRDLSHDEVDELTLVHRRGYLDGQADLEVLLPRLFNGGSTRGGDSIAQSGQRQSTTQNFRNVKVGKNAEVDLRAVSQQRGGNALSAGGGDNAGTGGEGGSLGIDLKIPGMPKIPGLRRREISDELEVRGLSDEDVLMALLARSLDDDDMWA